MEIDNMIKEPITLNGLNRLKEELIFLKEKLTKGGLWKIREDNLLNEVDMWNLTYYMIGAQNLVYKLVVMSKEF